MIMCTVVYMYTDVSTCVLISSFCWKFVWLRNSWLGQRVAEGVANVLPQSSKFFIGVNECALSRPASSMTWASRHHQTSHETAFDGCTTLPIQSSTRIVITTQNKVKNIVRTFSAGQRSMNLSSRERANGICSYSCGRRFNYVALVFPWRRPVQPCWNVGTRIAAYPICWFTRAHIHRSKYAWLKFWLAITGPSSAGSEVCFSKCFDRCLCRLIRPKSNTSIWYIYCHPSPDILVVKNDNSFDR